MALGHFSVPLGSAGFGFLSDGEMADLLVLRE